MAPYKCCATARVPATTTATSCAIAICWRGDADFVVAREARISIRRVGCSAARATAGELSRLEHSRDDASRKRARFYWAPGEPRAEESISHERHARAPASLPLSLSLSRSVCLARQAQYFVPRPGERACVLFERHQTRSEHEDVLRGALACKKKNGAQLARQAPH